MNKGVIRRRGFGKGKEEEVYLMATGLSNFSTGVNPSQDLSIEYKVFSIYGSHKGMPLACTGYVCGFFLYGKIPSCQRGNSGSWVSGEYNAKYTNAKTPRVFELWRNGSNDMCIDGEVVKSNVSYTTITGTLRLFNVNTTSSNDQYVGGMAYCKLWKGNELIRHYVPKVVNGVAGMYDKVNKTFNPSTTDVPFAGIAKLEEGQIVYTQDLR